MKASAMLLPLLWLWATDAGAEVYKCTVEGKRIYTDRPCSEDRAPADLPPLNLTAPGKSADLAGQYDRGIAEGRKRRDADDAKFVKEQAAKQARANEIRKAIIDHRALVGMTPGELNSALGVPDERRGDNGNERWTYNESDHRLTVTLRDGRVTGISRNANRKKR